MRSLRNAVASPPCDPRCRTVLEITRGRSAAVGVYSSLLVQGGQVGFLGGAFLHSNVATSIYISEGQGLRGRFHGFAGVYAVSEMAS
jgi:hypothetical protein